MQIFNLHTVERVYFARIYCSRMANQNFREHVFFANGQKNPLSNVYENAELNISRACIFREWSSNRENREK